MKKVVIFTLIALVIIISITAMIHRNEMADKRMLIVDAQVILRFQEDQQYILHYDEIRQLGEEKFNANLKSSGKEAEEYTYTGVPLINLIKYNDMDISGAGQIIVKSIDGYTIALSLQEVLEEDNIYLAYMRNGEPLGSKDQGGSGPYQIVIRKDSFSQRWAKYVVEVEIK